MIFYERVLKLFFRKVSVTMENRAKKNKLFSLYIILSIYRNCSKQLPFKEESIHVIRLTRQHERKENAVRRGRRSSQLRIFDLYDLYRRSSKYQKKAIEEMNIDAGKAFMAENGLTNIVVHAPYIINLGNTIKPEMFPFAVQFLRRDCPCGSFRCYSNHPSPRRSCRSRGRSWDCQNY